MPASKPNILFCFTDQQKATSLDLYNRDCSAARARNLERVAEGGTVFDAAYCPCPLCVPSRISMMTGRYPSTDAYIGHGLELDADADSLPDRLKAAGYRTYLAGKDHCFTAPQASGRDMPPALAQRYDRAFMALHNDYQPPEVDQALPELLPFLKGRPEHFTIWGATEAPWDADRSLTRLLTDQAIGFMDAHRREAPDQPFFMHWGIPDPHEFFQAPRDVLARFPMDEVTLPPNVDCDLADRAGYVRFMRWYFNAGPNPPTTDHYRHLYRVYLAMCQLIDDELGRLLDYLERNNLRENTIVVFASDHGDMAGELGCATKWNSAYEGMARVPLVISHPGAGLPGGRRCGEPVSLTDMSATLAELGGFDPPEGNEGRSMVDLMEGSGERDYAFVESGLPGKPMDADDTERFPDHRWDRPAGDGVPYDPPHRWTGRCVTARSRRYKLIARQDQRLEFYDLEKDPWETRNAADDDAAQPLVREHLVAANNYQMKRVTNPRGAIGPSTGQYYTPGEGPVWRGPIHPPFEGDAP